MVMRSKSLDERVLERLAEGELVTKLCRDDKMPSIRQLQRWRRDDAEFDDVCWSSEAQGLMIQRSNLIEGMMSAIEEGGPGSGVQIQGLRELLHENGRTSGRLIARMNDRAHLRIEGQLAHGPFFLGWLGSIDTCPECGYKAKPNIIEKKPPVIPAITGPTNDKEYVDVPMICPPETESSFTVPQLPGAGQSKSPSDLTVAVVTEIDG